MAPERSDDDEHSQGSEQNPFIAFRHHVDSLFDSVISLPHNIYSRGQAHSRMWMQHRQNRLREMDENDSSGALNGEKKWEEALRAFEDSEKEAKEWYDTVLKQITQRRDEHLESGMALGSSEQESRCGAGAEQDDYPPASPLQWRQDRHASDDHGGQRCRHRSTPRISDEHDYSQSKFLDWVWTGWGGPSTTSNMLWQREHERDGPAVPIPRAENVEGDSLTSSSTSVSVTGQTESLPHGRGPALSLHDPRVQRAISAGQCPGTDSHTVTPSTDGQVPLLMYLLLNETSPLQLESHPELGKFGPKWRAAYEDLIRSQTGEPLTTAEENEYYEEQQPLDWLHRVVGSRSGTIPEHEVRANGQPATVDELVQCDRDQIRTIWDHLENLALGKALQLTSGFRGLKSDPSQANWSATRTGFDTGENAAEQPSDELAHYLYQESAQASVDPSSQSANSAAWGESSTCDNYSHQHNLDGTRSSTHVHVETYPDGQQRTTERITHRAADGHIISSRSRTFLGNVQSNAPTSASSGPGRAFFGSARETADQQGQEHPSHDGTMALASDEAGQGFTLPNDKHEFQRLVRERFKEARHEQFEAEGGHEMKKPGRGWFWAS